MNRFTRLAAAPALAGAVILGPAVTGLGADVVPSAAAHDAVVGATPAEGAVLDKAPDRIELEFSANPRDTFNTVALSRDGEVLVSETPEITANVLSVDIPDDVDMTDGEYTVGFRITSSDGHPTEGSYTFTLATGDDTSATGGPTDGSGSAADTTATESGHSDDDGDDGLPGWAGPLMGIAGVIVIGGALVVLVVRLRRTGN